MKKFTKKICMEQLGLNQEEANEIIEVQERFPDILKFDPREEGFLIDARTLHEQLGVKRQFSKWIKDQIKMHEMVENIDYISVVLCDYAQYSRKQLTEMSIQKRSALGIKEDYKFTLLMAKDVCMVAGITKRASEDYKRYGKLWRKYFHLMEKALLSKVQWDDVRDPTKKGYIEMCKATSEAHYKSGGKRRPLYAQEANIINLALFDLLAWQVKDRLSTKSIRDSVQKEINQAIIHLQSLNTDLINMGMDYVYRRTNVYNIAQNKYSHIKELVGISELN